MPTGQIAAGKIVTGIGLALGGGSARGLAHIAMLEAFDELGLKPASIAGTSIGAIMGGLYAAGLSARDIGDFALETLQTRSGVVKRLLASAEARAQLWSPWAPSVVDGVTLLEILMPDAARISIERLKIPFTAVATDFYQMEEVRITTGPLIPAVAASASLPALMRPVTLAGRVLIDGNFVNPTPWDVVAASCRHTVAIDVTGTTARLDGAQPQPGPLEATIGATQVLFNAVSAQKRRWLPPDLWIAPAIGHYASLDFHKVREIMAESQPAKEELKRGLERLLARG